MIAAGRRDHQVRTEHAKGRSIVYSSRNIPTQHTATHPPVRTNARLVSEPNKVPQLSAREIEVLLAWLAADSKDDAASVLYISATTVSTHLTRIRAKYSACNRPARTKSSLFARAVQDGHTRLDEW
jgi:DNA-binding CsgD family transcriptional regulator